MAFIKQDRDQIDLSRDATSYTLTTKDDISILEQATTTLAGLMSAQDKVNLDAAGGTDLSHALNTLEIQLASSTGLGTTIPAATTTEAGAMSAFDKADLELLKNRDFFGDFGTVYVINGSTAQTYFSATSNITLPAGGYLMRGSMGTSINNTNKDLFVQLQHNGVGIGNFQRLEYKDSAGSQVIHGTTIPSNQVAIFNTFGYIQLTSDQVVSIDMVALETGNQAYVWDLFVEMVRYF